MKGKNYHETRTRVWLSDGKLNTPSGNPSDAYKGKKFSLPS